MAQRIRAARERLGLATQREFADMIGIEPRDLWRYQTESVEPSAAVLSRIADVTGVDLKWLINGTHDTSTDPTLPARIAVSEAEAAAARAADDANLDELERDAAADVERNANPTGRAA